MKILNNNIIKRTLWVVSLYLYFSFSGSLSAQQGSVSTLPDRDKAISYAYRCLNGRGVELNYKKAYGIFRKLAEAGDAEAFNAMGMMYKHGLGPKQDDQKALSLFMKSAEAGYAKACYNIGLIYRYGHGVKQDLNESVKWLLKARELGDNGTDYTLGYFYYKGFGVKQSYAEAISYFRQGAEKGDASSIYMLGLCYLNGRGVEQDTETGKQWIEQASLKGVSRATDLMIYEKNVDKMGKKKNKLRSATVEPINALVPEHYTEIRNAVDDNGIEGDWEGKIVRYDWSGEEIESETPLRITFRTYNGQVEGVWTESDTAAVAVTAALGQSGLEFDNIVLHTDRRPIELKTANFKKETRDGKEYISGNVSFYCDVTREYLPPSYVVLERSVSATSGIETLHAVPLSVYPNPFDDRINVEFSLTGDSNIRFAIYDMTGKRVYTSELTNYGGGNHHYSIPTTALSAGSYVLKMLGKDINRSVKLIK